MLSFPLGKAETDFQAVAFFVFFIYALDKCFHIRELFITHYTFLFWIWGRASI